MKQIMLVKIFTPTEIILECNALTVTMPGEEGVFGVLPQHSLLLANLQIGIVHILEQKNNLQYFIYSGAVQINKNDVNIVTEFAVNITNIQKTLVVQKIISLKEEIAKNNNQVKDNLICDNISKYESLLTFLN